MPRKRPGRNSSPPSVSLLRALPPGGKGMSGQWPPSPPTSQVDSHLRDTRCVRVLLVTSSADPMGTLTSRHLFPVDERFPAQSVASIVTVKHATPIYPGHPLFSLRLSHLKMTTANIIVAIRCEGTKLDLLRCQIGKQYTVFVGVLPNFSN